MSEASKLNFQVGVNKKDQANMVATSKGAITPKKPKISPDLASIIDWIEKQTFSTEVKENLVKQAKSCPYGALRHFIKNINKIK